MSEEIEAAAGRGITVRFERRRCIDSRVCTGGCPEVFAPGTQEAGWIRPDAATLDQVAEQVQRCPSGALTYLRTDGGTGEGPPAVNRIRILANGPLAVHADLRIRGQAAMTRAALCRCGRSSNQPFCDRAHLAAGFRATGEPDSEDLPALPACDGPLEVKPASDGPLVLAGNFELCSESGRTIAQGRKAALCRCGHSRRKPLCDGSHFTADFTAA